MISPALQQLFQVLSPASGAQTDHTCRSLRAAGLMPRSPRGRGLPAAEMTPEHAKWLLLAMAIERAPDRAVEVVRQWDGMIAHDGSGFMDCPTLGAALTAILADNRLRLARQVDEVRVCREWPLARIVTRNGSVYRFGIETADEARKAGFRSTVIRSEYVVSGSALAQLATDLASPEGGLFGGAASIVEGV